MDKAFSVGSIFGKFQYLTLQFKVALVPKRIGTDKKKNASLGETLQFFEKLLSFVLAEICVLLHSS